MKETREFRIKRELVNTLRRKGQLQFGDREAQDRFLEICEEFDVAVSSGYCCERGRHVPFYVRVR